MSAIQTQDETGVKLPGYGGAEERLTSEQLRNLSDPNIQEQYRQAYRLQQARLSCPGCGEYSLSF
jgi:hypothetical protein